MIRTSNTIENTARARLAQVESSVTDLWKAVRNIEGKLEGSEAELTAHRESQPSPRLQTQDVEPTATRSDEEDSSAAAPDLSPSYPPTHLLQLFDNDLLGSDGSIPLQHQPPSLHEAQKSAALGALMPPREDMRIIVAYASSRLSIYNAFLSLSNFSKTSDEMLVQYDRLQDPTASPVEVAALLLSIAIVVQQAPDDTTKVITDACSRIQEVSDSVERIVVSDDTLAGTMEGVETTLLFLRL